MPEPLPLITPTAVYADQAWLPHTPEWYAARSRGVGGSDIPAILGYSPYRSIGHVWAEKRGEIGPDPGGEAARWGTLLEDVISTEWSQRHDVAVRVVPTLRHVDVPHWIASLDRLVDDCPDGQTCALEVKNHSEWKRGSWRDDVPDAVLAQAQWQLHVTGIDHLHVAALIGGQQLIEHTLRPEAEVQRYLVEQADVFWNLVTTGVRPAVDSAELLLDLLDRLYPNREGQLDVDADTVRLLRRDYDEAAHMEKEGKAAKRGVKAEVASLLGPHEELTVDGQVVATYRPDLREQVDKDRLKTEFPDAYAACVAKHPTEPILRWKKAPA